MSTVWVTPESQEHWLKLRSGFVSSTESAALFPIPKALRPNYLPTAYRLWHEKHKGHGSGFKESRRTRRGKQIEWAIAQEVAEENGWEVRPFKDYAYLSDVRMGASFDAEVSCPNLGVGLMECKLVDYWVFEKAWTGEEAAPHIEIQVQHQLEVADKWDWACIAVWCGSEPKWLIVERDRAIGAAIKKAVDDFWSWNEPPHPDFLVDAETIRELNNYDDGSFLDLSRDDEAERACSQLKAASELAKHAEEEKTRAYSELLMMVNSAKKAETKSFKITTFTVEEKELSYRKPSYRAMRITKRKEI